MLILLLLPCLALALVSAGFLYQWLGARQDRMRYAGDGRFVDIGEGCRLYLFEKGSGGPTVLFESGIAATNLNWSHIQETVAQFTHTASYDRAGLGWSSRASSPRTPGNIAMELHAMLQRAGIRPPYVLVGHSFGGLVMRRYALLYPAEVAGVVLIDPMRPEEWPPLDPGKQATVDRGTRMATYGVPIARLGLARLAVTSLLCRSGRLSGFLAGAAGDGGRHVLDRIKGEVCKMPREVWPSVAAHWSRPAFYVGMSGHVPFRRLCARCTMPIRSAAFPCCCSPRQPLRRSVKTACAASATMSSRSSLWAARIGSISTSPSWSSMPFETW
jgi:pimeloyl-ACP methyl ester carboxylesterase